MRASCGAGWIHRRIRQACEHDLSFRSGGCDCFAGRGFSCAPECRENFATRAITALAAELRRRMRVRDLRVSTSQKVRRRSREALPVIESECEVRRSRRSPTGRRPVASNSAAKDLSAHQGASIISSWRTSVCARSCHRTCSESVVGLQHPDRNRPLYRSGGSKSTGMKSTSFGELVADMRSGAVETLPDPR